MTKLKTVEMKFLVLGLPAEPESSLFNNLPNKFTQDLNIGFSSGKNILFFEFKLLIFVN